jgi:hypothetical protein
LREEAGSAVIFGVPKTLKNPEKANEVEVYALCLRCAESPNAMKLFEARHEWQRQICCVTAKRREPC